LTPPEPPLLRIVPDPNALVSAFISDAGFPAEIHRTWLRGALEFIVSSQLLAELEEVLLRPKFRRYGSEVAVAEHVRRLRRATLVPDAPTRRIVPDDEKDDYLMILGKTAKADYVLSGDRHLTALQNADPPVITPRALYQLLVDRGLAPARPEQGRPYR